MQNCPLESSRGCMTPSSFKKTVGQTFQDLPLKDLDQSFVGFVFSPKLLKELEPVDQKLETEIKELLTTAPLIDNLCFGSIPVDGGAVSLTNS